MTWFLICLTALIAGYFIYGRIVERVFGVQANRTTPAHTKQDGVDYVPMPKYKVYLIQLLNIAGVGPIFGPIMGALYGPAAMIWIVVGCIFAGAVHDYFSGMLSVRNGGASVPNLAGRYLGRNAKHFMNALALVLLVLVGVVFVAAPANMLSNLAAEKMNWQVASSSVVLVIFAYYVIAALVPVDKIIGKLYPFFGALLVFMSVGIVVALQASPDHGMLTSFTASDFMSNMNPNDMPMWPALFITIACGAISGFHATQSPLMARCIENEESGRFVFYGAMIGEGIIALIWCAVALSFFGSVEGLSEAVKEGGPGKAVFESSFALMGLFGGILAFLGVIILPITSGDTAFRSGRLIMSEMFNVSQRKLPKRLMMGLPLFAIGAVLTQVDFGVIWRYFGFANQTTAVIMLWTAAAFLKQSGRFHWIATVPAMMMTTVVITFICNNPTLGFGLSMQTSTIIGVLGMLNITLWVLRRKPSLNEEDLGQDEDLTFEPMSIRTDKTSG